MFVVLSDFGLGVVVASVFVHVFLLVLVVLAPWCCFYVWIEFLIVFRTILDLLLFLFVIVLIEF